MRQGNSRQTGLMNASLVLENWIDDFACMAAHYDWGVLTNTSHLHIVGRGHRTMRLEKLF
jgi:hypothetical protein